MGLLEALGTDAWLEWLVYRVGEAGEGGGAEELPSRLFPEIWNTIINITKNILGASSNLFTDSFY